MVDIQTSKTAAPSKKPSHFKLVLSQTYMTQDVIDHTYPGSGTEQDPFRVDWIPGDSKNPYEMSFGIKWFITGIMSIGTLSVSLSSSAFAGAGIQIERDFGVSQELAIATVSLFVLGFALGPMTWGPMSEILGRQSVYFFTFLLSTLFSAASIASKNISTLLVLRFFTGVFSASSVVNSAAVIGDIFVAKERGLAIMVFTSAPFLGPTLGPICGSFLGQYAGWKWVGALAAIFTGVMWVVGSVFVPETYTPYLLIRRAKKLSKLTGKVYKSKLEARNSHKTAREIFKTAASRPWIILVFEPIVLALSLYSAIVYGIFYLTFTAFPVVFQGQRHWSQGISGLSYLGIMVGQLVGMFLYIFLEKRYRSKIARDASKQTPESRLEPALVGGVLLPVGLFWFAWTTFESVHWSVSIIGSSFFGLGQVLLFISLINYLIDSYTVFAASALAANAILRAMFGAAFPLFAEKMYENLGIQWASSVPAFLSLACAPMPFLFLKYGVDLRHRSKRATEAREIMDNILKQQRQAEAPESSETEEPKQTDDGGPERPV
ncbi:MFS general substrate transporter [Lasiosphaeria ovina]|uniref:MFS general substrate transporter n=1 Tax=Lasiosphaeria ovina TaxID=92902 RepID=A0AAE0KLE7_9PEZI|nr:MFS general substrate transporter [Lasiosphaeria ovina]